VVVGAPLVEETFFRGFLFRGLAASPLGGPATIVVTSLAWAAIHLQYDLYDMGTIFLLGLLLGAFRLITGSLWPPLLMHALVNLLATIQVAILLR
jgi:membrane protease YdiL (CAAX protease family)